MSAVIEALPARARPVVGDFHRGLREILGDRLFALWLYGAMAFHGDEAGLSDIDYHAVVSAPLGDEDRRRLDALHARLADSHGWLGRELDGVYVTLSDARTPAPPRSQRGDHVDQAWALHRAHWLADRVIVVAGPHPSTIVTPPTWEECLASLDSELAHVDAVKCQEWAWGYCVLQICRVLMSLTDREVVVSKRQAGEWALGELPDRWHPLITAALRRYRDEADEQEMELLRTGQEPFVAAVRTMIDGVSR